MEVSPVFVFFVLSDFGSKTVKPGWVCEDKVSLLIKCSNGVRLVKPVTVQSSSWPFCGRAVFTDRAKADIWRLKTRSFGQMGLVNLDWSPV